MGRQITNYYQLHSLFHSFVLLIFAGMANPKKAKKNKSAESAKFKPEKQEKVTLKQVAKDERTHKIIGAVCILIALFLFVAFTSFLFTWKADYALAKEGASALSSSIKKKSRLKIGSAILGLMSLIVFSLMDLVWLLIFSAVSFLSSAQICFSRKNYFLSVEIFAMFWQVYYFLVLHLLSLRKEMHFHGVVHLEQ